MYCEKKRIKIIFKKINKFYKLGLLIGAKVFLFIKFYNFLYVYNMNKNIKMKDLFSMDIIIRIIKYLIRGN